MFHIDCSYARFTDRFSSVRKSSIRAPRLNRESQLYGNEFELRIRNELSQKAIAKEAAEWIRQKVTFKSNISGQRSDNFMGGENKKTTTN